MNPSRLITASTVEVVSVDELALALGIDKVAEESDLSLKLAAAIAVIGAAMGRRQIGEATWERRLTGWPYGEICLDIPQVSSITSIIYTDSSGTPATLSAAYYKLVNGYDKATTPTQAVGLAHIDLSYNYMWPTATLDTGEPIKIRYVAGFAASSSIPTPIKQAILLEAGHYYRNRESVTLGNTAIASKPLARGVDSLISPYVAWRF